MSKAYEDNLETEKNKFRDAAQISNLMSRRQNSLMGAWINWVFPVLLKLQAIIIPKPFFNVKFYEIVEIDHCAGFARLRFVTHSDIDVPSGCSWSRFL